MRAFVFDTETTGLISNHLIDLDKQPSIIEFYGAVFELSSGQIEEGTEIDLLIKPPKPLADKPAFGDKKTITQITGITNEMLSDRHAFKEHADRIKSVIEAAPLVMAHNLSYDMEITDIEFERLGQKIDWPRGICTVEQTLSLKGFRLTASMLHEHLFGEKFEGAHRAKVDVAALVRCGVELVKRGIL